MAAARVATIRSSSSRRRANGSFARREREIDLAQADQRDRDLREVDVALAAQSLLRLAVASPTSRAPRPRRRGARRASCSTSARSSRTVAAGSSGRQRGRRRAPERLDALGHGAAATSSGMPRHHGDLVGLRGGKSALERAPARRRSSCRSSAARGPAPARAARARRSARGDRARPPARRRAAGGRERRVGRQQRVARRAGRSPTAAPGAQHRLHSARRTRRSPPTSAACSDLAGHRPQRLQRGARQLEPARLRLAPADLQHDAAHRRRRARRPAPRTSRAGRPRRTRSTCQ